MRAYEDKGTVIPRAQHARSHPLANREEPAESFTTFFPELVNRACNTHFMAYVTHENPCYEGHHSRDSINFHC